ncbi:MAG TPA: glycerol kinase GlpK [Candidatus Limnocylindrales bacterium]|nr:glycerol kinase GlpK [Candidatus Limnocylindrales bacterium]
MRSVPHLVTHAPRSLIAAIDQGTTSSRCLLFDHDARVVASHQLEHEQITPRPGWVEHDADEILERVRACVRIALRDAGVDARALAAVGISNQRETTVVWDRHTGRPVHRAIVWQDTRTADAVARIGELDRYRATTGLPVSTYSSALKLRWILDQVGRDPKELAFGTIDTWLLWNLTGGVDGGDDGGVGGGVHATDVTNASRTMLMNLVACAWDDAILDELAIPRSVLPEIRGSSEVYGTGVDDLDGVPIAGILGDQHAALFGQTCFEAGEAKCTYGTGAFMLMHTGITPVPSRHGLITTVAARLGGPDTPTTYALEGSVAVAGSLVQWLRDDLAIIDSTDEVESLARSVPDSGDVVFVPAFSGLFAPHWRPDARGIIAGLTRFSTKAHIARAALEATAYQVADLAAAMAADLGAPLPGELRVDGGMTRNGLLMQIQADILGSVVVAPEMAETTALGAAYAAGLAVGFWEDLDELRSMSTATRRWEPQMSAAQRADALARWHQGIERSLGWV